MSAEAFFSPAALEDIERIQDYIEADLGSPQAACRIVDAIFERIELLEVFPGQGTPLDDVCPIDTEYRFVASRGYLAFYRVVSGNVYIDRILYSKSNYLTRLLGNGQGQGA